VTPTLSVTTTVNVTTFVWAEVFNVTVSLVLLVNDVIVGFCVSLLLILTVILSVEELPAASVATTVTVSVLAPKL